MADELVLYAKDFVLKLSSNQLDPIKPDGPLRFKKELIYTGEFIQPTDNFEFEVTPDLLLHWKNTYKQMVENGVKVPAPMEHTDSPDATQAHVVDMMVETNSRNQLALYGLFEFKDEKAAELAKTADVSIYSPASFTDGRKNHYVRPIRHVALTDYPVIPGLESFTIVASHVDARKPVTKKEATMPLKNLLKTLSIECASDDEAAQEEAIVASFKGTTDKVTAHEATIKAKDEEIKALKSKIPSDPLPIVASHRDMLEENRNNKLEKLVDGGKISPAVRDKLAAIFCSEPALNIMLSHKDSDDKFKAIVEALDANEVVQLSSGTPPQGTTTLEKGKGGTTGNPLMDDIERRRKEAGVK